MSGGSFHIKKESRQEDARTVVLPNEQVLEPVRALLSEGKSVIFRPKGNSMLPFIRGGRDSVELVRAFRPLEVGDIALFLVGGRYYMHRVFAVDGDRLTFMGDGNSRGREYCRTSDVIGVVTKIIKKDGREVKPGKGKCWRLLLPFRRYIMALLIRTIYYEDRKRLQAEEIA